MANLVRRHLESMTEEIEEMKRLLFKEHEIKYIYNLTRLTINNYFWLFLGQLYEKEINLNTK